jgi:DNA-binding NarL/FixJ family response regulator
MRSVNLSSIQALVNPLAASLNAPTPDERRLLELLAEGRTDEVVARSLGCTRRTLQRRLRRIFEKLGAESRFQAGVLAERAGWIAEGEQV